MTPEEKAKELIAKFVLFTTKYEQNELVINNETIINGKQCAIICVEEVIQESLEWNQLESWKERDIFWNEVLTHLKS